MGHSSCAWCQLHGRVCILTKPGAREVCVCNHQQKSNWTSQWVGDASTQEICQQACAALVTVAAASPGGGGHWALCPYSCGSSPWGAVGSSTASIAVQVTICVSVLCVSMYVSLGHVLNFLTGWAFNTQTSPSYLCLGTDPGSPAGQKAFTGGSSSTPYIT